MVLLENLFILISGFTLLILSGDKLVETAVNLARRWNIPASVVAVTIIAAGTSAPELFTSFLAGFQGNSDISVGNVIGSNTFNLWAVGGISLVLQPFGKISGTLVSWIILMGASLLFFFSMQDSLLSRPEAFIFLGTLVIFIVLSFFREREPDNDFENLETKSLGRVVFFFVLSFFGLIGGAELALTGGVELGKMVGLSERVIAITIISAGTGLPELATSIAAAFRGHSDIAIANVIGSNIFNTLAIPGATAALFPLTVDENFINYDFYVMAAATLSIAILYIIKNPKARRAIGVLMFLAYSTYATSLLLGYGVQ